MEIRQAYPNEYERVRGFYDQLIDDMEGSEYHPKWAKGIYPEDEYLEQSVLNGEMYVVENTGVLVGAMILNHHAGDGYETVQWPVKAEDSEVTVIHTLGVLPAYGRQGVGRAMVSYGMNLARQSGQKAIRLDVMFGNLPAYRLYEGAGFQYVTDMEVFYEDTGRCQFSLYEYDLEREPAKAVIFDMDGVIFDTERLVVECWKEIADKYHITDIEETCRECLGLNAQATEVRFKEIYGADFPYGDFKGEMRELFFSRYLGKPLPVKTGVREVLANLKAQGMPVALATSTRSSLVTQELSEAGLLEYFDEIICGDMVTHSKPDPEIFLLAASRLGVQPEQAYVVEDSFNGIRAAYAGGFLPIMIPDRVGPDVEMWQKTAGIYENVAFFYNHLLKK